MNILIYKLSAIDQAVKKYYIGSTLNLQSRIRSHQYNCKHPSSKHYNLPVYQYIRQNGDIDNWKFDILESFECTSHKERLFKEKQYFINNIDNLLNKNHPINHPKEYYQRIRENRLKDIKIKHQCDCGLQYTTDHKARHCNTLRHKQRELYNITNDFDIQDNFNL